MTATPERQDSAAPDFVSPQLAAAMAHPTRVHAIGILHERTASPRQIAEEIGERLNNVTYHLNQLVKLGCIELARSEAVQGGRVVEHFYRTKQRLYFDEDAWQTLGERQRVDLALVTLRMLSQDVTSSMATGSFFSDDAHICRAPMVVDSEGWREITELLEQTTERIFEIEDRVDERTDGAAPPDIPARVALMQFRSPSPDSRRED